MLFTSIDFALFLPLVFVLYWILNRYSHQGANVLLLVASYVFYGWWNWRFLSLIVISSAIDYLIGLQLANTPEPKKRKVLLGISVAANLGMLVYFKYFNFFIDSFANAFTFLGGTFHASRLNIVLPVGISFYTFQTLSYTIDVYRRKLEPTRNPLAFFTFVSFFPQLVAGPIERATQLLPQFLTQRKFNEQTAYTGLRIMLWGFFKKIVVADNCALYVDQIFDHPAGFNALSLLLGAVYFAFQIYGDFSGYSDIARGTAKLFGFELMENFRFPYFSRDIAEFWRRWHISLTTWFRDYVYIPLGGSRVSKAAVVRNTFIIFLVSGLWHGASWTFVIWGALNALYFLPLILSGRHRRHTDTVATGRWLPGIREGFLVLVTFLLTCVAWIFFRAESVGDAWHYLQYMGQGNWLEWPVLKNKMNLILLVFIVLEWLQREKDHVLAFLAPRPKYVRWMITYSLILLIFVFGNFSSDYEFIYFRF